MSTLEIKLILINRQRMNKMESENSNLEKKIEEYIESLTETERIAMEIAKQHLGSSFDITKSVGFLKFN